MVFKEGQAPISEKEKLSQENYRLSQEMAKEEFDKLSFSQEELISWFNDKYEGYDEALVGLRDRAGQLLVEKKLSEISDDEKLAHSLGYLKLIGDNYNLNFIKHFFNEPELLDIAAKKGSYLKRTVQVYRDNLEKMKN